MRLFPSRSSMRIGIFFPLFLASAAQAGLPLPDGVRFKTFYDTQKFTFSQVIWFGEIPGKPGNFLVTEQPGNIWLFNSAAGTKTLFVRLNANLSQEGGLLAIAFHPKFAENRKFYVNYNPKDGTRTLHIAEMQTDATFLKDSGLPPRTIFSWPTPALGHQGSSIDFGRDGYLYWAVGDHGKQGADVQNLESLTGKVIRIDVDGASEGRAYGIPADNPFVDHPKARKEIFSIGYRNPWKLSVDPLTNQLWMGSVMGWYEDYVSIVDKGDNLGWPILEGTTCFNWASSIANQNPPLPNCDRTGLKEPTVPYRRKDHPGSVSVVGGLVYRANPRSAFYGVYFFAEYYSREIWAVTQTDGKMTEMKAYGKAAAPITHLSVDSRGRLYFVQYGDGRIFQIDHPDLNLGAVAIPIVTRRDGKGGTARQARLAVDLGGTWKGTPAGGARYSIDGKQKIAGGGSARNPAGLYLELENENEVTP